jgi:hypothetical protein
MMDFGYRALILGDPKDEYKLLCRALGVEPFRIGPGLPTRINPLAFGPIGDGWDRLDAEEALNRATIVLGRWLTLVRGLVAVSGSGNTGSRSDPATRSSSRPHCSTSPATATVTAAPTYREPQPVTGGRRSSSAVPSPLRRASIPSHIGSGVCTPVKTSHRCQAPGRSLLLPPEASSARTWSPSTETSLPCVTGMVLSPATGTSPVLTPKSSRDLAWHWAADRIEGSPERAPDCTFTSRSRSTALRSTRSGSWPIAVHPLMARPLHRQGKQYRQFRSASPGRIRRPVWGFSLVNYLPVAPGARA